MILEFGLGALLSGVAAVLFSNFKQNTAVYEASALIYPKLSDAVTLVVELLKSDDGWICEQKTLSATSVYLGHSSGVRLYSYNSHSHLFYAKLYILDSDMRQKELPLTREETNALKVAIRDYAAREEDTRKRELTKLVAERIISGTSVLGGSGVPELPAASDDDSGRESGTVSAGLLTYDPKTQLVHKVLSQSNITDSVRMTDVLQKRYGLSSVPINRDFLAERLGLLEYDPSSDVYVAKTRLGTDSFAGKPVVYEGK